MGMELRNDEEGGVRGCILVVLAPFSFASLLFIHRGVGRERERESMIVLNEMERGKELKSGDWCVGEGIWDRRCYARTPGQWRISARLLFYNPSFAGSYRG